MGKRKGDRRWLWTVVITFGLLSFAPFVWAAIQVRTRRFKTAAVIVSAASAVAIVCAVIGGLFEAAQRSQSLREAGVPDDVVAATVAPGDAWATWVIAGVWLGTCLYALYLNPEYLEWRARRLGGENVAVVPTYYPSPQTPSHSWAAPQPMTPPVQQITNHIYGGTNNVNAQATVVQAGGDVRGVNGGKVAQSASSAGLEPEVVLAFISQYRAALRELDVGSRQAAEAQLDQLSVEMASSAPDEAIVSRNIHTLKALAHHAVTSGLTRAAATAGSAMMATLLNNWPF